jgi:uncharacterized membrane protein
MKDLDLSRLERHIRTVLRVGIAATAVVFLVGLALWLSHVRQAELVLQIGLSLLMAIPVTRIIASCVDAVRRRDWLLTWSTIIVLSVMVGTVVHELIKK